MQVDLASDNVLRRAELLLRLSLILVMFFGGLGKMFAWEKFVDTGAAGFVASPLPMPQVRGFLYCVPVIELALGTWIISGFRREWALFGVGVLLLVFQFGHMMMQDFPGLSRVIVDLLLIAVCLCLPPFRWGVRAESRDWHRRAPLAAALLESGKDGYH
jgi:thiosulfate dehydrogenase [quinone] large subunit